jgi:hypothetical protein
MLVMMTLADGNDDPVMMFMLFSGDECSVLIFM